MQRANADIDYEAIDRSKYWLEPYVKQEAEIQSVKTQLNIV